MNAETRSLSVEVVGSEVQMNLPCGHVLDMSADQADRVAEALTEAANVARQPETMQ